MIEHMEENDEHMAEFWKSHALLNLGSVGLDVPECRTRFMQSRRLYMFRCCTL